MEPLWGTARGHLRGSSVHPLSTLASHRKPLESLLAVPVTSQRSSEGMAAVGATGNLWNSALFPLTKWLRLWYNGSGPPTESEVAGGDPLRFPVRPPAASTPPVFPEVTPWIIGEFL